MTSSTLDWEIAPWYYNTYRKFLSNASQVALNASVVISNQLCHGIHPSRPLSRPAPYRCRSNSSPVPSRTTVTRYANTAVQTIQQAPIERQNDSEFDAYLLSQGPRALEVATETEYRKDYQDALQWRRDVGIEVSQQGVPADSQADGTSMARKYGVFERSVEKRKQPSQRARANELEHDWIRYCQTYNSRGGQYQSTPPPVRVAVSHRDAMDTDSEHRRDVNVADIDMQGVRRRDWNANLIIPGRPQPIEPGAWAPRPPTLETPNSTSSTPYSPGTLSVTSANVPPPLTYEASSPSSPTLGTPWLATTPVPREKKTPYFALYPPDHKLGYDCSCHTCQVKLIKKQNPDALLTLYERRAAKRQTKLVGMPAMSPHPAQANEAWGVFNATGPQNSRNLQDSEVSPPVRYFVSGNVTVPMYSEYDDQFLTLARNPEWMLGDTVMYDLTPPEEKAHCNKKRKRDVEGPFSGGNELPAEEYGAGKRRRK